MGAEVPFELKVLDVRRTSPSIVRIGLAGPPIASLGVPDEACVLHLPLPDGGRDDYGRWYTIRAVEPRTGRLDIDVVTHDGGVGAGWARRAEPGDRLGVSARNSWYRRGADTVWQVLIGDVAALPAIGRIAEETPEGVRTTAVVEVPDPGDEVPMPAHVDVTWVHNPDLARRSRLEELARGLGLASLVETGGPGYVYVAGEAAATRGVRKHLRHELGMRPHQYGVIGYWRMDNERWMRRYERTAQQYERIWAEAEATGSDEEEAQDIYEARLAEAGLL
ncbi:siderophore-interacting protein [Pseudonocardia sp. TRM90224]|uniref:siderophore-interacting protein n=1 Tax=Pseudonocardia sp. TRM90224 TaxID=2812678 RepID=UPI001E38917E|nr:siderophore-interacting protein [Pseudonocardia sp. TRM90224]